jgi:hypothetical protein
MFKSIAEFGLGILENLYFDRPYGKKANIKGEKLILLSKFRNVKCTEKCTEGCTGNCESDNVDKVNLHQQRVREILPKSEYNESVVTVDRSGEQEFIKNNPLKVTLPQWQMVSRGLCYDFGVKFKVESQDVCDELALDIKLKNIPCDVKMNLAINEHLQNCDIIKFTRTPIECKYDYNILVERWTDCNLSLEDYNRLYSKKFTFNMVDDIYRAGLGLELREGDVYLRGKIGTYNLNEVCFSGDGEIGIGSYKTFIERALEDLDVPNEIKKEILACGPTTTTTVVPDIDLIVQYSLQGNTYSEGEFKDQVVRVRNIGADDSEGVISVFVSGVGAFDVVFDPNMTVANILIGTTTVNNSDWTPSTLAGGVLYTSSVVIPAGSESKIGLSTEALVAGQDGNLNIAILNNSGGDNDNTNNSANKFLVISL